MIFNPKKTLILKFIYSIIVFSGVYISFISSNRDNPVRLSYNNAQELYSILPQGWAFFTRNPKEEVLQLYKEDKSNLKLINNSASLSFKDVFGLKRDVRKKSAELAEIIKKIPSEKWETKKSSDKMKNLINLKISDTVINVFNNKLLTGDYIIVRSRRKPWAWSNSSITLPYRCIKIHVK